MHGNLMSQNRKEYLDFNIPLIANERLTLNSMILDDGLYYIKRRRTFKNVRRFHQSFSNFWVLLRGYNLPNNKIYIKFGDQFEEMAGTTCLFIPPFCINECLFKPGTYEYEAFSSYNLPDSFFPNHPILFPHDGKQNITCYSDVADLLIENCDIEPLGPKKHSYVAQKAKLHLDRFFVDDFSIADLARDIKVPYTTMTPYFTKHYGITPVQYRNMLRGFEALRRLKNGENVTKAGLNAGFQSISQYNHHFHRLFAVSPSTFRRR